MSLGAAPHAADPSRAVPPVHRPVGRPALQRTQNKALRFGRRGLTVFFGGIGAVNLVAFGLGRPEAALFHAVSAIFAFYLLAECLMFLRRSGAFGLLSPVLLASVVHFGLAYLSATVATLQDPWILGRFGQYLGDPYEALTGFMLLAMLAAFAMWRGYQLGRPAARWLRGVMVASPYIRKELNPAFGLSAAIQTGYFALVALAIHLRIFGIASSNESREAHIEILGLMNLAFSAGTLTFFLIATYYFRQRVTGRRSLSFTATMVVLVTLHLGVGALSGFKSQMVMPFVMLALAYFVALHKISRTFIVFGAFALFLAYQVIEPYRAYLNVHQLHGEASLSQLLDVFDAIADDPTRYSHESDIGLASQIASRFDLSGFSAMGIAYSQSGSLSDATRRHLADSILLSPVLAFVPRAIWSSKPQYQTGVWFNQTVRGKWHDENTSVGMGPIALTHMAGGVVGVVLCFTFLGWLQAVLFEGAARSGVGGLIVYFSGISMLVFIPTEFGLALGGLWRILPFALLAQFILLRPSRRSWPARAVNTGRRH